MSAVARLHAALDQHGALLTARLVAAFHRQPLERVFAGGKGTGPARKAMATALARKLVPSSEIARLLCEEDAIVEAWCERAMQRANESRDRSARDRPPASPWRTSERAREAEHPMALTPAPTKRVGNTSDGPQAALRLVRAGRQ